MSTEKRLSRRQLLRKLSAVGAGLAFVGPILAACGPTFPISDAEAKERVLRALENAPWPSFYPLPEFDPNEFPQSAKDSGVARIFFMTWETDN